MGRRLRVLDPRPDVDELLMKTKLTRRQLLKASLGAAQLGLLGSFGLFGGHARAAGRPEGAPSRLVTIYIQGGWMPIYAFCPLSPQQILERLPEPGTASGEPAFFTPDQVRNLDGTGDAPDPNDPSIQRLRVPHLWDEAGLSAGMGDARSNTAPHMWAYREYDLHQNVSAVHGIDMKTAAHEGAVISAMCGAAGSNYRAPAVHSVVAARLHEEFKDVRPLPAVALGSLAPVPVAMDLSPEGSPTILPNLDTLQYALSERPDVAWEGLRDRTVQDIPDYSNAVTTPIGVNRIERRTLDRLRSISNNAGSASDAYLESMYDMYKGVSTQLARDIISMVEAQNGWENLPHPHWVNSNWTPYGLMHGRGIQSDSGTSYANVFDLALRLMKADVTSAISLGVRGNGNFYFDTHGQGHPDQFLHNRSILDCVGRFLGEMKATMMPDGKSLLDDTLVLVFSEFARTWPNSNTCDHWPITSTLFAGGPVWPNRMIGNYDFEGIPVNGNGPNGASIAIVDEGEVEAKMRPPTSADVVYTALSGMGIHDHFIPGGAGTIQGVFS